MKKLIALILALVMALSLCACSGGKGENQGTDDEIGTSATGTNAGDASNEDGHSPTQNQKPKDPGTINLNDYLVFHLEGYSGCGVFLRLGYDVKRMMEDYPANFADICVQGKDDAGNTIYEYELYNSGNKSKYYRIDGSYTLEEAHEMVLSRFSPEPSLSEEFWVAAYDETISNGDNVQVSWEADEENLEILERLLGLNVVFEDFTYIIHTLTDTVAVDPLERVSFNYEGESGEATLVDSAVAYVKFPDNSIHQYWLAVEEPENNGTVKNGDLVFVSIKSNIDNEELAEKYGISFTRTEGYVPFRHANAYGRPEAYDGDKATINLNDYLHFSMWGNYNEYGVLQVRINYRDILFGYYNSLSENVAEEDLLGYHSAASAALNILEKHPPLKLICKEYKYDAWDGITEVFGGHSNGDEIRLQWEVDEENLAKLQKVMNVEFVYSDFTHTIEGLKEIVYCDLSELCEITFNGTNGNGFATGCIWSPDHDKASELKIVSEKNGSLSNGDVIVIRVEDAEYYKSWLGVVLTNTEIEVTVAGLS